MRTLIYARYSSQLQNARSIEDQIAACRDRADREGWEVVEVYTDYAISGGAGVDEAQRPGINALLAHVDRGGIDQVLADTTSRIARDQGDAHHIRKRLNYRGARLFTLADGEIDAFKGAIKGLLDEQQRRELAHNIKRGQRGAVGEGRAPAGLAYGYRRANRLDDRGELVRGLREIDPDQAAIVVRIFTEFAEGASGRTIAERLNRDRVPGPRGKGWTMTTILGDRQRQNGMLKNRLYAGELVHNRTSKVTDPVTRRERIRPNPPADWIREPVPALRIVSEDLWNRVQQQLAQRDGTGQTRRARMRIAPRPRRLLSGLGICGVCGGSWIVISAETWGCAHRHDGRGCTNRRTIRTHLYEERVLRGLREGMLDPAVVSAYVKERHQDYGRRVAEITRGRARLEKKVAESAGRIDRLVDAIARGADIDEVKLALATARAQRDAAAVALREMEDLPVVALHPRIADDYRTQMDSLGRALDDPADDVAADSFRNTLRSLIDRIVISPAGTPRGVEIAVEGRLAAIIALATGEQTAVETTVVSERVKPIARKHRLLRAKV